MSKVVILGAGASHGHGIPRVRRPPLASGFFSGALSRTLLSEYSHLVAYLHDNIDIQVVGGSTVDIEGVFSSLEASWRLGQHKWRDIVNRYGTQFVSVNPIDMLRSYITDMVYRSTRWLERETCPYHRFLAEQWLLPGDTAISFNYDLVIDTALKRHAAWSEMTGYGFYDGELARELDASESDITLLKPHGSLNWFRSSCLQHKFTQRQDNNTPNFESIPAVRILPVQSSIAGETLQVRKKDYIRGVAGRIRNLFGSVMPSDYLHEQKFDFNVELLGKSLVEEDLHSKGYLPLMVMPTPNKPFSEMVFAEMAEVWKKVRAVLEEASQILAIGFSFRDEHFNQVLFEATRQNSENKLMTVVTRNSDEFKAVTERFRHSSLDVQHHNGWFSEYACI